MIVIDASETRSTSRMPKIENSITSKHLEALTGADVMVSAKKFPASNQNLILRHIEAGAILIQFKFGSDLISSITDERVNIALARMIESGARHQYQRVILGVGFYLPDVSTGKTLVGRVTGYKRNRPVIIWRDSEPSVDYRALATVRRRISMRGGTFVNLTCDDEVPGELISMEKDLVFLSRNPVKELLHLAQFPPDPPDPDDPLQRPVEVKDWRRIIAGFKGIGPKRAKDLYDGIRENLIETHSADRGFGEKAWTPTLIQALGWILECDRKWAYPKKIKGWGDKTRESVREQLGLVEGQDITVRDTMFRKGEK